MINDIYKHHIRDSYFWFLSNMIIAMMIMEIKRYAFLNSL